MSEPARPDAPSPAGRSGRVEETLVLPVWSRAVEDSRSKALFRDPTAARLWKTLGRDDAAFVKDYSGRLGVVLRTLRFDGWTRDFLSRHPEGTVVEAGVGLNTRYERVTGDADGTGSGPGRWFELDLPDVMEVRRRHIAETERRKLIAGSLTEPDWIETAAATGGPWLINIEGVLMYLDEGLVSELFRRIAERLPGAVVTFDSLSTEGVAVQRKRGLEERLGATFTWTLERAEDLKTLCPAVRIEETGTLKDVAIEYAPKMRFMLLVAGLAMATIKRRAIGGYAMTRAVVGQ